MKTFNRKTKVVISLLMVLVMLFSTLAVTVSADTWGAEETVKEVVSDLSSIPTDTPWYTITFKAPENGEAAKLDIQLKPDVDALSKITKADVAKLLSEVYELAVKYAANTKLGEYLDIAKDKLGKLELLSASSYPGLENIPDSVKNMLKDYAKEKLGVESIEELEEKLTVDVENGVTAEDVAANKQQIQANIENLVKEIETTNGGVAAVVGTALKASGATDEDIAKVVETVNEIVVDPTENPSVPTDEKTIFVQVMEKVYGEEVQNPVTGEIEIVIPEEKKEIVTKVTTTIKETVEEVAQTKLTLTDVIKMFKGVSVDGSTVLSRENGITINGSAITAALKKIPMPGELANYSVEDYKTLLSYSFGVEFFVLGEFNLDVSLGITGTEGQISKINSVMKIIADHVDVDLTRVAGGGEIELKIKVPAYFAKLVLKAAESDMIPDNIKHKLFACLDKDLNDVVAFISEELTVEDIVAVLQSIDYEKIIDASLGKDLILKLAKKFGIEDNLQNLTNEQLDEIIDKLAAKLGKYYNMAMPYIVKAAGYVNEFYPKGMETSIADLYAGDGVFHGSEDVTITEDRLFKVLDKAVSVADNHLSDEYNRYLDWIQEKAKFVISAVMGGRSFTVAADVTVEFLDVRQVTFVNGANTVKGFLPVGADINYFANNASVFAWMDAQNNVYTAMPNADITLYPVGDFATLVKHNGAAVTEIGGQYTADGYTFTAEINYARKGKDGVEIIYKWYTMVGGVKTLVSEAADCTVTNVKASGSYWCEIIVIDTEAGVNTTVETDKVDVQITKAPIDVSGYKVEWSIDGADAWGEGYTLTFVDGTTYTITLTEKGDYGMLELNFTASASESEVGEYVFTFDVNEETEYLVFENAEDADNYYIDGYAAFLEYLDNEFNNTAWSIQSVGAHEHEFTVKEWITEANCTEKGTYYKKCSVVGCGEYEYEDDGTTKKIYETDDVDPTNHNWTDVAAKHATYTESGYTAHKLCTRCGTKDGYLEIPATVDVKDLAGVQITGPGANKFTANDVTGEYENHKFPKGQFGKGLKGTIILAYDINPNGGFIAGKTYTIVFDIPADYVAHDKLAIYHFNANGDAEEVSGVVIKNGQIIFEATEFSVYSLVAIEERSNWWVWLLVALGAILVVGGIVVLIVVLVKRKKATYADDTDASPETATPAAEVPETEEGETVDTTPSVGEAAIEVSELTSAQAESPVTDNIAEEDTVETEPVEEIPAEEAVEETPVVEEVVEEAPVVEEVAPEAPVVEEVVEETPVVEEVVEETPVVEEVVEEAPVVEEVVEETPVVEEVVEETPVAEEVVEETPVVEEVVEETPVVEEVVEETPVVEEVVEEAPVVEEVVEETPVVEEVVEETPVVEEVVEEAPVVEVPVEEAPAEEPVAEAEAPAAAIVAAPDVAAAEDSIVVDGEVVYVHYRSSFTSRFIQASETLQDYYTTIKNYILSYTGVKAKTSWNYEVFTKGRTQCVKLNIKGKALTLNLALNPKEYSATKYHFTDLSDNPKFANLPMLLKVKSDRGLKYALELITEVMTKLGIEQGEIPTVDYRMPYESNASLAKRGIVKVIVPAGIKYDSTVEIREANVSDIIGGEEDKTVTREEVFLYDNDDVADIDEVAEEPVAEAPEAEAPAVEEAVEEAAEVVTEKPSASAGMPILSSDDTITVEGNVVLIRYRSSFTSRLIQAANDVQDYYTALKNHLLSYKGVKSRTSWNYETFAKGRTQCARINIKGKTLTVNLALLPESYNANKYHFTDLSDNPKFDKLPMLLKVRSARALKYAIELIDELMKNLGVSVGKVQNVDYHKPYESNSDLARRGLMKIILPAGVKIDASTILREENVDTLMDTHKQTDAPAVETAPEAPVVEEVAEETPVVEEVVEEAPVVEEVVEETPVVEEVVEEAPVVEEVVEEAPVVEEVVEETPVVEEVAPEAPVVEEVVEEVPAIEEVAEETPVVEEVSPEAPAVEEHIFTDAQHADEMVNDYVAEHSIEVIKKSRSGKMVEVNIDDICANFEDGDVVTLEALKAKRLVNKAAGRVKVLAKGVMTKCLTVEADKFSLQAVKMITLAGGTAKRYN